MVMSGDEGVERLNRDCEQSMRVCSFGNIRPRSRGQCGNDVLGHFRHCRTCYSSEDNEISGQKDL